MPISTLQHVPDGQNDDQSYKINVLQCFSSLENDLNEEFWIMSTLPQEYKKISIVFTLDDTFLKKKKEKKRKTTLSVPKRQLTLQNYFEENIQQHT